MWTSKYMHVGKPDPPLLELSLIVKSPKGTLLLKIGTPSYSYFFAVRAHCTARRGRGERQQQENEEKVEKKQVDPGWESG